MMRPFLPIVLLLGACGDNMILDSQEEGPPVEDFPDVEAQVFVPDVCSVRAWPTVDFADRDVDLSVAATPTGAAVFSVERTGGPLRGFLLNARGEIETKEEGNIIRDDHAFTAVSVAYIDERLIAAGVTDEGSVTIDMVRNDLGDYHNLSTARGSLVADLPIAHAREQRLATVGGGEGVTAIRYDGAWQTMGVQLVDDIKPLTMTSTRFRDDTMVAWSTASQCTLSRIAAEVTSVRNFPCLNGRIAMNASALRGYMVYEEGADKVMISEIVIGGHSEIANQRLLVDNARAPKIVFDGTRYWVSYINARQDVVMGYIGNDGSLVSMALEGTQPIGEAYELSVVNGGVWIFAVDGAGANAQRLCLKPVR